MQSEGPAEDIAAIEALIARQFGSLNWAPGSSGDWTTFEADFSPEAVLYPSARPAKPQSVSAFIERMKRLCETTLTTFHERVVGTRVQVFGSIAVAVVACEMAENAAKVSRNVEMMLLIKDEDVWRIVSQAWDRASSMRPIPDYLSRHP
jgi:surfactin synthase thioesterase subunit